MERQNIKMSDEEFEVLDQLYFVTSYVDLKDNFNYNNEILLEILLSMASKGWLKCFENPDVEIEAEEHTLRRNYLKYQYLASKQGLLAHNSR